MLNIFICEDDPMHLNYIQKCISDYISMEGLAMDIVCTTTSPYELLNCLQSATKAVGMYFLDLDLGCEMNGIELAVAIRNRDPIGFIVFITSDGDSHKLTFKHYTGALQYIEKNNPKRDTLICESLNTANAMYLKISSPGYSKFTFKSAKDTIAPKGGAELPKGATIAVDADEILYFETSTDRKHIVVMYTNRGRHEFRDSLKAVVKRLDKTFYQCQRNLVINLNRVSHFDDNNTLLYFDNGYDVDISAKHAKKLKSAFLKLKN